MMKTAEYLNDAGSKILSKIKQPFNRPIDVTLEQKETQCRLNGAALMYVGTEVYKMNVDAHKIGFPMDRVWIHIHHVNSFE